MLAQMQVTTIVPSLAALLEHPEFQAGVASAREQFLDDHEAAPLTEDEMIDEVELELSRRVIEGDKKSALYMGINHARTSITLDLCLEPLMRD